MSLTQALSDKIIKVIKDLSRLDRYGADKEKCANTLKTGEMCYCHLYSWFSGAMACLLLKHMQTLLKMTRFRPIFSCLNKAFTILDSAINLSSCLTARFLSPFTQQSVSQSQGTSLLQFSLASVSKKPPSIYQN